MWSKHQNYSVNIFILFSCNVCIWIFREISEEYLLFSFVEEIISYPFMYIFLLLLASDVAAELEREMAADDSLPAVKHYHDREYSGMYEYKKEDEQLLIKHLITGNMLSKSLECSLLLVFSKGLKWRINEIAFVDFALFILHIFTYAINYKGEKQIRNLFQIILQSICT